MRNGNEKAVSVGHDIELQEWLESLEWIIENEGPARAKEILEELTRLTLAVVKSSGASNPLYAGTPWRWLCVPIRKRAIMSTVLVE